MHIPSDFSNIKFFNASIAVISTLLILENSLRSENSSFFQQIFTMATAQAAFKVEQALGHHDNAIIEQDISDPAVDRAKYADPSGATMKALVWMGKNKVEVREYCISYHVKTFP
jgi:hypothetical protein